MNVWKCLDLTCNDWLLLSALPHPLPSALTLHFTLTRKTSQVRHSSPPPHSILIASLYMFLFQQPGNSLKAESIDQVADHCIPSTLHSTQHFSGAQSMLATVFLLYQSTSAVRMKYHRPEGLNHRHLFSPKIRARNPRSRGRQGWFFSGPSPCVFTWSPIVGLCFLISSYKDTAYIG